MVLDLQKRIRKSLIPLAIATQFLLPSSALAEGEISLNPFLRPIPTLEFYGSGDVDGDGDIDGEDYDLISTSEKRLEMFVSNREMAERADVVPDEVLDERDAQALSAIIERPYDFVTRDGWNELTREGRIDLVNAYLAIDKTDEISLVQKGWDCEESATIFEIQFGGFKEGEPIPSGYVPYISNLPINVPTYTASYSWPRGEGGVDDRVPEHVNVAITVGDTVFVNGENNTPLRVNIPHPYGIPNREIGGYKLHPDFLRLIESQTDEIIDKNTIMNIYTDSQGNRLEVKYLTPGTKILIATFRGRGMQLYVDDNQDFIMYGVNYDPLEAFSSLTRQEERITAIAQSETLPEKISIINYPNPFNPNTTISYDVATNGEYSLIVYDGLGQVVKVLEDNEYKNAGNYEVSWNGTNSEGQKVGSGIYFSRLAGRTNAGDLETKVGKMTVVK